MKKSLLLATALFFAGSAFTYADTVVGNESNNIGFWQDWSESVNIEGDGTIHFDFYNYSDCLNNWDNWILVLTNSGLDPKQEGYGSDQELAVFRADRWGWGAFYNGDALTSDWEDWDAWRADQDGAHVLLDITREGSDVSFTAETTAVNGTVYNYTGKITGVESEILGAFLTVECGHLVITETSGIHIVANELNNAPVEYYNLNGVRINENNLSNGIYIKRQGNTATKVIR